MPLDYDILKQFGTTDERIREVMTAHPRLIKESMSDAEKVKIEKDVKMRKRIEDLISSRIDESMIRSLKSTHLFSAVDLAWDSSTISKRDIPLVMYAQGRIKTDQCVSALKALECSDQYVKNGANGKVSIDLPKFLSVSINLVRSIITRRLAAQSARYTNLWPYFKYDTRGTSDVDRLRGDMLSQRVDIMVDQFGLRDQGIQWLRDMLLYPRCMVFPASKWEREIEYVTADTDYAEEFQIGGKNQRLKLKAVVKREGVPFVCPHGSRTFFDAAYPCESINTDTGCSWFGFWDVDRYSSVLDNEYYFNRADVTFGEKTSQYFANFANYFSQYYENIEPPLINFSAAQSNDAKEPFEYYTADKRDTSVFKTHFYMKLKPVEWGFGYYPNDVWVHFTFAGSRTCIHAEIMPDCPGFVFTHNASSQRALNLSMAHEIMGFQDQLTNLTTQLIECAKRDVFGVALLNLDCFPPENKDAQAALEQVRKAIASGDFQSAMTVLEVSMMKMRELGVDLQNVFHVIRQPPNTAIENIIKAIAQTIQMAERVMAMSPQEQAQLSPRETSATEVQVIAGTTENVYQFISDSYDAGRAAIKRYLYNAFMSLGSDKVELPVMERYTPDTVKKAGFTADTDAGDETAIRSILGDKNDLRAEYIFTTRDGAERASNIQAAQTLVQMVGIISQPITLSKISNEDYCNLLNTIMRLSGAGVDALLKPASGKAADPVIPEQLAIPQANQSAPGGEIGQVALPKQ